MKERAKEIMTITLIGINILVFIVLTMIGRTEDGYFMLQHGAMYEPYIIENQEYYRLFTSLFLHFGISHLLNNMVLLWALGSIFEKEAGKIRFLFCYFISMVDMGRQQMDMASGELQECLIFHGSYQQRLEHIL